MGLLLPLVANEGKNTSTTTVVLTHCGSNVFSALPSPLNEEDAALENPLGQTSQRWDLSIVKEYIIFFTREKTTKDEAASILLQKYLLDGPTLHTMNTFQERPSENMPSSVAIQTN